MRTRFRPRRSGLPAFTLVAPAVLAILSSSIPATAGPFTGLGDLPGGSFDSHAQGISAVGSVVVGDSNSTSGFEAMRWTPGGGIAGLGDLPGSSFDSIAFAVSADGSVAVGRSQGNAPAEHAFRWSAATGMVDLGTLGGNSSVGLGVSNFGSVVVGNSDSALGTQAFMWTAGGGIAGLGALPGGSFFFSAANGVSADGQVIVGQSRSASGNEAFRWTAASGMVGMGDLPGSIFSSAALAASANGSVIAGWGTDSAGKTEAFRWTASGGMQPLGDLPGGAFFSVANAVSGDGLTVVGRSNVGPTGLDDAAFIWDQAHGMRNLRSLLISNYGVDLTGWKLSSATGVNGDGTQIVGFGTNPQGGPEAWFVDLAAAPVPEPASMIVWSGLALITSCWSWRLRFYLGGVVRKAAA